MMIERTAGETIAAPRPWKPRATIRNDSEVARPHASEEAVKTTRPDMNTRRRPSRSAARPPRSRKPPKVIAYMVITHCRLSLVKFRARPIEGSATLTIETSRIVMKKAAQTSPSAFQRRGSGAAVTGLANESMEARIPRR